MGLLQTARDVYLAVKDDATAVTNIRAEYASLASAIAVGDGAGLEVTSATVNGQTFSGQVSMTKADRLKMLGLIIKQIDNSAAISSRTRARF